MRYLLSLALFSALSASSFGLDLATTSTRNAPPQYSESLSAVSSLSSLSDDLVFRLTEREKQTEDSEANFKTIISDYEARWMRSELGWEQSRKDHEATLNLLSDSETAYESLKESSEDRASKDAEKIRRLELDQMKTAALWAAGGVVVGVLVGLLL